MKIPRQKKVSLRAERLNMNNVVYQTSGNVNWLPTLNSAVIARPSPNKIRDHLLTLNLEFKQPQVFYYACVHRKTIVPQNLRAIRSTELNHCYWYKVTVDGRTTRTGLYNWHFEVEVVPEPQGGFLFGGGFLFAT